jgi:hypothetical protein
MDEEDWVDVVMPPEDEDTVPSKLKGEPYSDSDDAGDHPVLPKDVCDGSRDIDRLEEPMDSRACTDAALSDDEGTAPISNTAARNAN